MPTNKEGRKEGSKQASKPASQEGRTCVMHLQGKTSFTIFYPFCFLNFLGDGYVDCFFFFTEFVVFRSDVRSHFCVSCMYCTSLRRSLIFLSLCDLVGLWSMWKVLVIKCVSESRLILNEEEGVGFDSLLNLRVFVFKRKVGFRSVSLGVERKARELTGFDLLQAWWWIFFFSVMNLVLYIYFW